MFELYKTRIGIAAGVVGTLFIGYCIYFDHKRRKDPEYKNQLRERRYQNRNQKSADAKIVIANDQEAIERYFLQEIQLGETQIACGDFQSGVEHLANAIVVCGRSERLLQVLQTSLPAQVSEMLAMKMLEYKCRTQQQGARIVTLLGGIVKEVFAERSSDVVLIDDID